MGNSFFIFLTTSSSQLHHQAHAAHVHVCLKTQLSNSLVAVFPYSIFFVPCSFSISLSFTHAHSLSLCQTAHWSAFDGAKWNKNDAITSAFVADGVADLSTGEKTVLNEEKGVFGYCFKLESVRLPESLRWVGVRAFFKCKALVHVDIPSGVEEIGYSAFQGCVSLRTVTVPEGILDLPEQVFNGCSSLESVELPSSLKTIGNSCFNECSSLTKINFEKLEGVTEIGVKAFCACSSLTAFKLPRYLKTVKTGTFWGCASLSKVDLPPFVETMKDAVFEYCHCGLTMDLPETLRNIEKNALRGCCIRLPTTLPMLTNGGDVTGLLQGVKDVVVSVKAIPSLVDHINSLPLEDTIGRRFLRPDLMFKVLYSFSSSSHSGDAQHKRKHSADEPSPPLSSHIHESFFSFDVSAEELKNTAIPTLRRKVYFGFKTQISIYKALLTCKTEKLCHLPLDILYVLLPFICGDALSQAMIEHIHGEVKQVTTEHVLGEFRSMILSGEIKISHG